MNTPKDRAEIAAPSGDSAVTEDRSPLHAVGAAVTYSGAAAAGRTDLELQAAPGEDPITGLPLMPVAEDWPILTSLATPAQTQALIDADMAAVEARLLAAGLPFEFVGPVTKRSQAARAAKERELADEQLGATMPMLKGTRPTLLTLDPAKVPPDLVRKMFMPRVQRMMASKHRPISGPLKEPCWLWTGPVDTHGMPLLRTRGHAYQVRRAWLALMSVPASLELERNRCVVTICARRTCVNPAHLKEAAPAEYEAWLNDVGPLAPVVALPKGPRAVTAMPRDELDQTLDTLADKIGSRKERACELLLAGHRTTEVANMTGLSAGRISQLKKALGIPRSGAPVDPQPKE